MVLTGGGSLKRSQREAREELFELYLTWRGRIEARLRDFRRSYREGTDHDIFAELVFCLLTPQSKARLCWAKVGSLCDQDLLLRGGCSRLSKEIDPVRFKNNKARYIVEARRLFKKKGELLVKDTIDSFKGPYEAREWLVKNVRGMGYKEASHFLRNVGKGRELAILDRHVLKNLVILGVVNEEQELKTPTRKGYLEIEERMSAFSRSIGIPMDHLDLILWCKETGEIFK